MNCRIKNNLIIFLSLIIFFKSDLYADTFGTESINSSSLGSGPHTLNGVLTVTGSSNVTMSGILSGSGGLRWNSSGTLTLKRNNTYSGNTDFENGTLEIGSGGSLPSGTVINFYDGGQVYINLFNGDETIGGINDGEYLSSTPELNFDNNTLTINVASGSTFTSGATVTGQGSGDTDAELIKTGAGEQIFQGSLSNIPNPILVQAGTLEIQGSNTIDGGATISGGTLELGHNGAVGSAAITMTGGQLSSRNTDDRTLSQSLFLSGSVELGDSTNSGNMILTGGVTLSGDTTITTSSNVGIQSNALTDGSNSFSLTKAGSGSLNILSDSSYDGGTTINAGNIIVGGLGDLGTGGLTIAATGTLDLQKTLTIASLNITGAGTGNRIVNNAADSTNAVLNVTGTSTLVGTINTDGTQTYSGATSLSGNTIFTTDSAKVTFGSTVNSRTSTRRDITINNAGDEVLFSGIVGGSNGVGDISVTGALDLDANIADASSLSISQASNIGANVTTTNTQTYTGNTILSASNTLTTTNSNVVFSGTVNSDSTTRDLTINSGTGDVQFGNAVGATNALGSINITGNLDLNAAIIGASSVDVSGTSDLGGNVTTTGNQTFSDTTTLSTAVVLQGSTINLNAISGGSNAMTITGNLDLDGDASSLGGVRVSGTSNLGGDITSSSTQLFVGATTLSGGDRTLTGSTVTFNNTVTGGSNALTITGNLDSNAAMTGLNSLSVSGTTDTATAITTTGDQTYTGAFTYSGSSTGLFQVGSSNSFTFGSTVDANGQDLLLAGDVDLDGAVTNAKEFNIGRTANIGADVTTTSHQTYTGAVTLSGGDRTFTTGSGKTIAFNSGIDAGGNELAAVGDLQLTGSITNPGGLDITGQVTVNSGGTLVGAGTISSLLDVTNGGALKPGNSIGTLNVGGDMILASNSTTTIEFSPTANDQILVTGTANIDGTIVLEPVSGTYSAFTRQIITGGAMIGTFSTVSVSNSTFISGFSASIVYDNVNHIASLKLTEQTDTVETKTNQNKFKSHAKILDAATSGSLKSVADALITKTTAEVNKDLRKTKGTVLSSTIPVSKNVHASFQQALTNVTAMGATSRVGNLTRNFSQNLTLADLQESGLYGDRNKFAEYYDYSDQSVLGFLKNNKNRTIFKNLIPDKENKDKAVFVRTFGSNYNSDNITDTHTGFSNDTFGILYGQQYRHDDKNYSGFSYGFTRSEADYNENHGDSRSLAAHFSTFKQASTDEFDYNIVIGGHVTETDSKRNVIVSGSSVSDTYKSNTTDFGIFASSQISKTFNFNGWGISPSVGLKGSYDIKDDFKESGGDLALTVDSNDLIALKPEVGISFDRNFTQSNEAINQLNFSLIGSREHYIDGTTAEAKYANSDPFTNELPRDEETFLSAGFGYNYYNPSNKTNLIASYFISENTENDQDSNVFSLTFRKFFGDFAKTRIPPVIAKKPEKKKDFESVFPKIDTLVEEKKQKEKKSPKALVKKATPKAYNDNRVDCDQYYRDAWSVGLANFTRPQLMELLTKCKDLSSDQIQLVSNRLLDIQKSETTFFDTFIKGYLWLLVYLPFITLLAGMILVYEFIRKGIVRGFEINSRLPQQPIQKSTSIGFLNFLRSIKNIEWNRKINLSWNKKINEEKKEFNFKEFINKILARVFIIQQKIKIYIKNINSPELNSSKFKDEVNKILAKIFFLNEKFKTFIKSEKTLPHKVFDIYEIGEKQILKLIKKIKKPKN